MIYFQEFITREDVAHRRDVLFVFGDNELRRGTGGQAKFMRGESNAVGIATKRLPTRSENAYWSDNDFDRCAAIIDADFARLFEHVKRGGSVVIPRSGIGTGRSELPARAPRLMEHIRTRIRELMSLAKSKQSNALDSSSLVS